MQLRIPCSAPSRRERTFAQLILRIPRRLTIFEGRVFFRCGSFVEESALHPTPAYPATPLLLEYAGNDRSGRGHRRSNDIHILWRWNKQRQDWDELARVLSQGPEWFHQLAHIARRELTLAPPINFVASASEAATRVVAALDAELDELGDDGRSRLLSMLHDQFLARLVELAS